MVECEGAHHTGCACHEAQRDAEVASLRAELEAQTERLTSELANLGVLLKKLEFFWVRWTRAKASKGYVWQLRKTAAPDEVVAELEFIGLSDAWWHGDVNRGPSLADAKSAAELACGVEGKDGNV